MPLCDLFLQHLVDQLMLLNHCQAFELRRLNLDRIHGAATAADVLDLKLGQRAIHTTSCVHSLILLSQGTLRYLGLPFSTRPRRS